MSQYIDFRSIAHALLTDHPASNLYFLLDQGGLPDLRRQLQESSVQWVSLFDATNEAHAFNLSPILMLIGTNQKLETPRLLFEWIGKNGTYTSTVLILASPLKIEVLKNRLIQRLDITLSENMNAMLRFFDPRVFEGLMNVLDRDQITTFLSPAEKWWYVDRGGKIVAVDATFSVAEKSIMPLELSARQEFDLIDGAELDQVLALLKENAPDLIKEQPLPEQCGFVAENIRAAKAFGLTSIAELALYNMIVLIKGAGFTKGADWSILMDKVASKSIDFLTAMSAMDTDETRQLA